MDARTVFRPVESHLDDRNLRIVGRLDEKSLGSIGETVVGEMDENVTVSDLREHGQVDREGLGTAARHGYGEDVRDLAQCMETGQPLELVHIGVTQITDPADGLEPELLKQKLAHFRWHGSFDFEADDRPIRPIGDPFLDCLEQVVSRVLTVVRIGASRDPERVRPLDFGAGKQGLEVGAHNRFERHQAAGR